MLFRRGAGSGPGAARVFGAWRPAWRGGRSAGAAFPRNTLQEIAEATSRGARPKAAKPHGTKRGRPLPKGPFTAPEARLPSRQRMLPLKPGQMNDLRLLYQPETLHSLFETAHISGFWLASCGEGLYSAAKASRFALSGRLRRTFQLPARRTGWNSIFNIFWAFSSAV